MDNLGSRILLIALEFGILHATFMGPALTGVFHEAFDFLGLDFLPASGHGAPGHSCALDEFIVEGVKTTIPFHKKLMRDEKFRSGVYATNFLETFDMTPLEEE